MTSLFIENLNDFIEPSQSCVNPIFTKQNEEKKDDVGIVLKIEDDPLSSLTSTTTTTKRPNLILTKNSNSNIAQVSLNDCLACSGCVTTAEAVIVQQQSINKFYEILFNNITDENKIRSNQFDIAIMTISPEVLSSLTNYFELEHIHQTLNILQNILINTNNDNNHVGIDCIINMSNIGTNIALIETYHEFLNKKNHNQELPLLVSSCPGWICYAEKTCHNALPYISTVKSGQQINGILLKNEIYKRSNILQSRIYHIGVMPCFDRKLESSRNEFLHEDINGNKWNETDLVITTQELLDILKIESDLHNMDVKDYFLSNLDNNNNNNSYINKYSISLPSSVKDFFDIINGIEIQSYIPSNYHNESGGYIEYIYRKIAKEEYNIDIPFNEELPYKKGRNPDFEELKLEINGEIKLNFAKAYGFRNIQAIIMKLKRNKCPYDFVEIMACPSGCINGGGQIKNKNELIPIMKERINDVLNIINNQDQNELSNSNLYNFIYNEICPNGPLSNESIELFHTQYNAIQKLETSLPSW